MRNAVRDGMEDAILTIHKAAFIAGFVASRPNVAAAIIEEKADTYCNEIRALRRQLIADKAAKDVMLDRSNRPTLVS